MNTNRPFASIATIAGLTLLCFACSSSAPPATKTGEQKTSGDKTDKPATTTPPQQTDPTEPADEDEDEDEGEDEEDPAQQACYDQCLAPNAAAVALEQQMTACFDKCGEEDEACFTACEATVDQLCSSQQAACDAMDACETKCFPNSGEEEE